MRVLPSVVLLVFAVGCSSAPNPATALCAEPEAHLGERVRIPVALGTRAFRTTMGTVVFCKSQDGGAAPACCNLVTVFFKLPCGDGGILSPQVQLVPAAGLMLAPTDYGPYVPLVLMPGDPMLMSLGCLGCEAGLSCSPTDPGAVKAVWGALLAPDGGGYQFAVDELE